MSDTERNKAVVRQFVDALSRADGAALLNLLAEDGRVVTMGTTPLSGSYDRTVVGQSVQQILGMFPEGLKITLNGMIAEGDKVAAEAESYGRLASGGVYSNQYHYIFTLRDGKIVEFKEYFDTQRAFDILCGGKKSRIGV